MSTAEIANESAPRRELQEACDRLAKGIAFTRDEQDAAMKRIERIRETIRQTHGIQDVAVDLIREGREGR